MGNITDDDDKKEEEEDKTHLSSFREELEGGVKMTVLPCGDQKQLE